MSQSVRWRDVTEYVRELPSPTHERIVSIMQSVDKRYRKLGPPIASDPTGRKSRFTEWVNNGAGGHQIRVIAATYAEEKDGPIRRVFCMLYDPDPVTKSWTNVRLEILGVDREHLEHCRPEQWDPSNFERWYRDLRRAIVALATTGVPSTMMPESASVQLKAYVPAKCDWQPMCAFHEYMLRRLGEGKGGRLVHPSVFEPLSDWVNFEFVFDCS
jgi:hypothetical protein